MFILPFQFGYCLQEKSIENLVGPCSFSLALNLNKSSEYMVFFPHAKYFFSIDLCHDAKYIYYFVFHVHVVVFWAYVFNQITFFFLINKKQQLQTNGHPLGGGVPQYYAKTNALCVMKIIMWTSEFNAILLSKQIIYPFSVLDKQNIGQ